MVVRVDASAEAMVLAYCGYQWVERGLAERTVYNSAFVIRQLLAWRAETGRRRLETAVLHLSEVADHHLIFSDHGRAEPRVSTASCSGAVTPFNGHWCWERRPFAAPPVARQQPPEEGGVSATAVRGRTGAGAVPADHPA